VRRLALIALLGLVSCYGDRGSGTLTLEQALAADWDALEYEVVTTMPEEQRGGLAVVFLHGYGRNGAHYSGLAQALLDDETRVILPTAILPHSAGHGGMWWEFLDEDWPKPYPVDPSAQVRPEPSQQLPRAREAIVALIARIRDRYEPDRVALAGHSQGAMLALDVAMVVEPPVDRVAFVSAYVLVDSVPNITRPRNDPPAILVSHGRHDELVGFHASESMRKLLEENGFAVTFKPHDGAHAVNEALVRNVRDFLR
jgi:phospholipase/carboxylesterase